MRIRRKVLDEIVRRTKRSYPLELFGYLIGDKDEIKQVIWPRQLRKKDECSVLRGEVDRIRKRHNVIGTVHSHPDEDSCFPSSEDLNEPSALIVQIIVSVWQENGRRRTHVLAWRPLQEIMLEVKR